MRNVQCTSDSAECKIIAFFPPRGIKTYTVRNTSRALVHFPAVKKLRPK